jgi:hypothetical protein
MAASPSPSPAAASAPASTPSASASSSRRWADYSDDEEEEEISPRSYCEVLRSGSPPSPPLVAGCSSPVALGGGRRPWTAALHQLAAEAASGLRVDAPAGGVEAPAGGGVAPAGGVESSAAGVADVVGASDVAGVEAPVGGVGPWMRAGGRKRPRGQAKCSLRFSSVTTYRRTSPVCASIASCRSTTSPRTALTRRRASAVERVAITPVSALRLELRRVVGGSSDGGSVMMRSLGTRVDCGRACCRGLGRPMALRCALDHADRRSVFISGSGCVWWSRCH